MSLAAFNFSTGASGNVAIEVRSEISGQPLVGVYADPDGLTPLGNPFTAADGSNVRFHVDGGEYKITATKDGFAGTWRYVPIGTAQKLDIEDVLFGKRLQVRAATTANITISTALNNGDTLDGLTLATNDLVLVKDQTLPAQNGVYVVGAVPARSTEFDTYDEHAGAVIFVSAGTAGANTAWASDANVGGTLDTTSIHFTKMTLAAATASATAPREVTAAGAITATAVDEVILVNKTVGAATTVNLPTAASVLAQTTRTTFLIVIKDHKGDAETNNITIVPNGAETIDGQASVVIASNKGAIAVRPVSGTGWVIT